MARIILVKGREVLPWPPVGGYPKEGKPKRPPRKSPRNQPPPRMGDQDLDDLFERILIDLRSRFEPYCECAADTNAIRSLARSAARHFGGRVAAVNLAYKMFRTEDLNIDVIMGKAEKSKQRIWDMAEREAEQARARR